MRRATSSKSTIGPLTIGQQFGSRYHILKELGIGGMGAVYQAWDAELEVAVAVKVIRPEVTRDPAAALEIERRFKQELLLARQVTHRNVVRIHDLGEIDGIKYITMPYIEGADLATVLRDEKLTVAKVLAIARELAAGLQAAHEAGVVHRDLKPANVMIEHEHAIIMDFGIARSTSRGGAAPVRPPTASGKIGLTVDDDVTRFAATVVGEVIGTIEYMAPEQARGAHVDQRADIYAFGLIVYDMLVGRRRAEHAVSAVAELQKRLAQAPPPVRSLVPAVPETFDALVTRCVEPDPEKRFQTTAELVAALDRLDDNGKLKPKKRVVALPVTVAIASALLTLSGYIYWITRPPIQHDPVSVVIADLVNSTGDPSLDSALAQTLRRALEDASFISAYDRSRIGALGIRPPETLNEAAARDLAVKQGLGVVLSSSIEPRRGGYRISVKAIQTVSGDVITSTSADVANKDQVLGLATRLMTRVRSALGDETTESAQLFAMRSVSASSLDVVSHYAAAVEAQSKGQYENARERLLEAVNLDPKFGLGYLTLAIMSRNLDRQDDANKYVKEALRYLDAMTDREKFATRGFFYTLTGDNQQCAKEFGESLVRYPADNSARNQRAGCLVALRRLREATDEMRQAVKILPKHVTYRTNLALLENLTGDFQLAEDDVRAIEQPTARTLLVLAYSQLGRGLLQEAAQTYEKLATMGTVGASSAALGLGDLAVYEGRFSDARRIFEQGAAEDLKSKTTLNAAIKFTSMAYAHLMAGQKGPAIAAAERALLTDKSMAVRFLAARIFVEAGAVNKARPLAAALSAELPAESQAHGKIIEAQIALNAGKPPEAIKILTEANALLDTWIAHFDLGRAYLAAGALPQADSEFDRCLARRGEALSLMGEGPSYGNFPLVYYYQGRVREEMKTASFADSYGEYPQNSGGINRRPAPAGRPPTSGQLVPTIP